MPLPNVRVSELVGNLVLDYLLHTDPFGLALANAITPISRAMRRLRYIAIKRVKKYIKKRRKKIKNLKYSCTPQIYNVCDQLLRNSLLFIFVIKVRLCVTVTQIALLQIFRQRNCR